MSEVGGGGKKVLYTLKTARKIGLLNSARALKSNNACKACGLGMGGQRGGMTNELGEFPAVCNKSVQAQSTDIQQAIPAAVFQHSLNEFRELTAHQLEHLGRLGRPLYKAAGASHYREVEWDWALDRAAGAFLETSPGRSFFYSSGRSSNEAGFVLQLMARLYGTNNISNCSYYCHQATGEALAGIIGAGTATVELEDLTGCDLFFLIGANPASNHPRLLHKLIELRRRGGKVIVINPMLEPGLVKFAAPKMPSSMLRGGDQIASMYLQPRVGTDIALFTAIAKRVREEGGVDADFVHHYTNRYAALESHLEDASLEGLLQNCDIAKDELEQVVQAYLQSHHTIFAWGMGMTHHRHGVGNVEWIGNLALMRGMVGKRFAGLLPLRGHSNVQGIGTIGVKPVLADDVFRRMEQEFAIELPRGKGLHTLASLERAHAGEMDAALLMGGNLYQATPDSNWAKTALERIGFKLFLTTTLNRGHVTGVDAGEVIVLPVCARDEEPEPTTQESMFNFVRLSDGGIERIASVRSETAVLADLASRMLVNSPVDFQQFKRHKRVREAIARIVPGMEALGDIDVAKREFHIRGRIKHRPEFNTADGRAHFALPPGNDLPGRSPGGFTLMTLRSEGQFNSIIYEESDSYRGTTHRWVVFMNREDALEMGVNEGEHLDLLSDWGEMPGLEVRIAGLPRGGLAAYYPEANTLSSRVADPRSHTPQFKSIPVSLRFASTTTPGP